MVKGSEKWEGAQKLVIGDAPGQVEQAYALGQLEVPRCDLQKQIPVRLRTMQRIEEWVRACRCQDGWLARWARRGTHLGMLDGLDCEPSW